MDRRVILGVMAAIAVLSAAVGWVAGQRIRSPAEVAAQQEAPEPSLISVPVELRTLSQNVVIRGTVTPSDETELVVNSTEGSSVVTRLTKETGDLIDEGDVIIEVAGRPVIALEGPLPAFRNVIPALEGPDVTQLEQALVRLGYDPGPVDERYTPTTSEAVAELYRDRGYAAPGGGEAEQGALDAAEATVEAEEQAVTDAENALDEARRPVTDAERARLDLAIEQAELDLEEAKANRNDANAAAASAVTEAEAARAAASSEVDAASQRLQQARDGTHPDTGQAPTGAELAELEAADAAARAALSDAEAALASAQGAVGRTANQQDLAVRSAEIAITEAKTARTERLNPPDVSQLQTALSDARKRLETARTDLTAARSQVGAWIPTTEIVFFSSLPRQVATTFAEVGDIPTGPAMTISGAETIIESGVSAADRRLVEVGAEAVLEDDDLGISLDAIVTFVAENPGGPGLSDDRYAVRLEPVGEVPDEAINQNLRISIPITSSGGDVLAVPLAALSAGADGTARVEVERSPGSTELVEVSTGLRASGFVEIEPLEASLAEGDRVVVGRDLELPVGDSDGEGSTDEESDDGGDGDG